MQTLWKTVWMLLKKLNIELPYDPAILLLGVYAEKMKTLIRKDMCTSIVIVPLFTVAKIWFSQAKPQSQKTNRSNHTDHSLV